MYVNQMGLARGKQLFPRVSVPRGTLHGLGDLSTTLSNLTAPSSLPTWGIAALVFGALIIGPKIASGFHKTRRSAKSHSTGLKMLAVGGIGAGLGYYFAKQGGLSSL